jgi:hypothetical protein
MSHKNSVHGVDVNSTQPDDSFDYRHLFLFALVVAVLITLFGLVASLRPASSDTAVSPQSAVPYSDALAMQYAQPWLDKQAVEAAPAVRYSNALEMQYAQPWLDAQKSDSGIQYGNGMALFYALRNGYRPAPAAPSCNDRADWLYACQNSSWRPGD